MTEKSNFDLIYEKYRKWIIIGMPLSCILIFSGYTLFILATKIQDMTSTGIFLVVLGIFVLMLAIVMFFKITYEVIEKDYDELSKRIKELEKRLQSGGELNEQI